MRAIVKRVAAVWILATAGLVLAEEPLAVEDPVEALLEENEAGLQEQVEGATGARRKLEEGELEKRIGRIREVTGLDAEGAERLREAGLEAIEATEEAWKAVFAEEFRKWWRQLGRATASNEDRLGKVFDIQLRNFGASPRRDAKQALTPPEGRPWVSGIWTEALEAVLEREGLEAWEAELEKDRKEREAKLREALEATVVRALSSGAASARLLAFLGAIKDVLGLDGEQADALRGLGKKVDAKGREQSIEALGEVWRQRLPEADLVEMLDSGRGMNLRSYKRVGMPDWEGLLKQELPSFLESEGLAEEAGLWAEVTEAVAAAEETQIEGLKQAALTRYQPGWEQEVSEATGEIELVVNLEPERRQALLQVGEEALAAAEAKARAVIDRKLEAMSEIVRSEALVRLRVSISSKELKRPLETKAWSAGIQEILTAEERQLWEIEGKGRDARAWRAVGYGLVLDIQEDLPLGSDQRDELAAILAEAAKATYSTVNSSRIQQKTVSGSTVYLRVERGKWKKRVEEVLTPAQQELLKGALFNVRRPMLTFDLSKGEAKALLASGGRNAETVEALVSQLMSEQMAEQRRTSKGRFLGELAWLDRELELDPGQRRRLEVAAQGAAEMGLDGFSAGVSGSLRSGIRKEIAGAAEPGRFRVSVTAEQQTLSEASGRFWEAVLARALTPEQLERRRVYQAETAQWELETLVELATAIVDSEFILSLEQRGVLAGQLVEVIESYREDLEDVQGSSAAWYQRGPNVLSLVWGLPEEERREIFTERQLAGMERMTGQARIWERVEQVHRERLAGEEKK